MNKDFVEAKMMLGKLRRLLKNEGEVAKAYELMLWSTPKFTVGDYNFVHSSVSDVLVGEYCWNEGDDNEQRPNEAV